MTESTYGSGAVGGDAELCGALAATGLAGTVRRLDPHDFDDHAWARVLRHVELERLSGLLLASWDDAAGLPRARRDDLVRLHRRAMATAMLLERTLVQCVEALADAGVESRVLKGSAVARLDYANPSQREFGDVDLMVRPDQFADAVAVLGRCGFHRQGQGISSAFDQRFGKGVTLASAAGVQLDLHRTFVMGRFGLSVDLSDVWADPEPFTVAGRTMQALSPEGRLLHAAYHAVLGGWPVRYLPYRDVAEMVLFGRWDDTRLRSLSRRWRADAVLATAVNDAWDALGLQDATALTAWAQHYRADQHDTKVIGLHQARESSYAAQQIAALGALPWSQRASFAAALALPSQEFLRARHTTLLGHLTRSLSRGLRR